MSEESSHVDLHTTNVDTELNVKVHNISLTNVTLSWDAVKGVDGYIVGHNLPENTYQTEENTTKTSDTSILGEWAISV